jgi:tetratricopeptide (TPR) repeat protein
VQRKKTIFIFGCVFVTASLAAASLLAWRRFSQPVHDLPQGVSMEDFAHAAVQWEAAYGRPAQRSDTLVWLGDAFAKKGELTTAIACYDATPTSDPWYGLAARLEQAKALAQLKRAREAEENLREFIAGLKPDSRVTTQQVAEALDLLRHLLEVQLRFEERVDILRVMHAIGAAGPFDTLAYCFPTALRWNGPEAVHWLEEFWRQDPTNFRLRVALGRYRMGEGRLEEAQTILVKCFHERPADLHAGAALLACHYEQDDWENLHAILKEMPGRSSSDPWLLLRMRGHVHNRNGNHEEALACFQQVLNADPANAESYQGVAQACSALGREAERVEALRKMQGVTRIQNRLGWATTRPDDPTPLVEIAAVCQEIGLFDQSRLIAQLALTLDPGNAKMQALLTDLESPAQP